MHLSSRQITRVADKDTVFNMVTSHQCIPNAKTTSMSHVQLSPDGKKVMMRLSVDNCPVFGALGCIHLESGETYVISDKPVHQLWYDSDTYMATRQYVVNGKIDMASSRIQRFSMSGECLETLGGIANHIDASPNRQWFTGDRAYPGYPCDIFLYRRGCTEPALTFGTSNYQTCIWKHQIHANPTFSLDGKRIYFNYAADEDRAEACYIDISSIVG